MSENNGNLYLETLSLLEENGWASGKPHGPHGEMCLAVAFQAAAGCQALDFFSDANVGRQYVALGNLMREQYGYVTLIEFNDDPETSFEDVAMLLKRASELAGQ